MRGILPFIVGAACGVLVVSILLGNFGRDGTRPEATSSSANSLAEPDFDEASSTIGASPSAAVNAGSELEAESVNARIAAITRLGERDIERAIFDAMALPEFEQRRLSLRRLAAVFAASEPLVAIELIGIIDDPEIRTEFVATLLDEWAMLDPSSVFAWLESADRRHVPVAEFAFEVLAGRDPERLLTLAAGLNRDVAEVAMTAAFESLSRRDPASAATRVAALPAGVVRTSLEIDVAIIFGERSPEEAWEWAKGTGRSIQSRLAVVRGIQVVNPDLAWELVSAEFSSPDASVRAESREYVLNYAYGVVNTGTSEDVIRGLDRLLSLNDPDIDEGIRSNVGSWARREPEAALEWVLANADRFDPRFVLGGPQPVLVSLSSGLARTNLDLARQTLPRLTEAQRIQMVTGIGRYLSESDLSAARAWAYEFPRGGLRDAALNELIRGEAYSGSVDRQLFDQFSDDGARDAAADAVARRFACDGHLDRAREIATTYIADERVFEQTERAIAANAVGGSAANVLSCAIMR